VAKDSKDDNAGKDGGERVEDADEKRVPVAVIVDIVVAGQHQLTAKPNREGEQDLRGGHNPDLDNKIK